MATQAVIWLIPVVPAVAFIALLALGRVRRAAAPYIGLTAAVLSLVGAIWAVVAVGRAGTINFDFIWLTVGNVPLKIGMYIDPLAAVMLVVVTTVSLLVQIYSIGYMKGEKRLSWYYAAVSLFTASMLSLVIANNFLQLYISWELVGLCSYLLIGFWYEKKSASSAAMKAFIITRIGDVGFFLGLALLFVNTHTFDFSAVRQIVAAGSLGAGTLTAIALLFFAGAAGKSAQFPLHVWLPDAMEGPTPVSALIHAATMVAAGVYLVARSFFIFEAAHPAALQVVAGIGAFTAILAAVIAVTMTDIKKVLAYSTISQLGFMMAALGVGGYTAAIFHLTTHAFFKALLFLGAGSVIHGAGTQNIYEMGGLLKKMKVTGWTFLIATLSIAGIVPLSGFWSKDEILTEAAKSGNYIILGVLLVTAFLTAFYMFRLYFVVFTGPVRDEHAHESPAVMTYPLLILAVPAALLGLAGSPLLGNWFTKFIALPGAEHIAAAPDYLMMGLSTAAALAGIGLAWVMYKRNLSEERFGRTLFYFFNIAKRRFFLDELYQFLIVRPIMRLAAASAWFDIKVLDGAVNSVGPLAVHGGYRAAQFDSVVINNVYDSGINIIKTIGEATRRRVNTGLIPRYLAYILAGFVVLAVIVYVLFVMVK